jgi:hypothetical protein
MAAEFATKLRARSGNGAFPITTSKPISMLHHGGKLVRLVADTPVMGDGDPSVSADRFKPFRIRAVGREVIPMALDLQAGGTQDLGKGVS